MQIVSIPTVHMYMDTETHALSAAADILVAVRRFLDEGVTGAPVVTDEGHVVDNLSEYDCLRLLAEGRGGDMPRGRVRDFMATTFTAVPPSMDVYYVAGMFLTDPANRRFMVMERQRLAGWGGHPQGHLAGRPGGPRGQLTTAAPRCAAGWSLLAGLGFMCRRRRY